MQFAPSEKCGVCEKTVYKLESITITGKMMHKTCFRCTHCNRQLSISNFADVNKKLYCKTHYEEIFKSAGGRYEAFKTPDGGEAPPKPARVAGAPEPEAKRSLGIAEADAEPAADAGTGGNNEGDRVELAASNSGGGTIAERMRQYKVGVSGSPDRSGRGHGRTASGRCGTFSPRWRSNYMITSVNHLRVWTWTTLCMVM